MLSDLFQIHYRHPVRTPIQLLITGNQLTIDCCFRYNKRALRNEPATGRPLADRIDAGIREHWSGAYLLDIPGLDQPIDVRVVIHHDGRRRSAPIRVCRLLLMPAHVISPLYRRLWGIFKTGHLESLGSNWSLQQPGTMILPIPDGVGSYDRLAAHEAGHLFGIGDAYAAIYRFYDAVPGAERFMMYANDIVQPQEILMLLRAHQKGRMQFFPRTWQGRRFREGLRKDISQRFHLLKQRFKAWRRNCSRDKPGDHAER